VVAKTVARSAVLVALAGCESVAMSESRTRADEASVVNLPDPDKHGAMSLGEALERRRSVRDVSPEPLQGQELSQLLWAAQGTTSPQGFRTAPSAGATYPLELYLATVEGVFHYEPRGHKLRRTRPDDVRPALERASGGQPCVGEAGAILIITAVHARTEKRYGIRAARYVHLEAGHAAQNVLLMATSLGLGAVPIGAFTDSEVGRAAGLPGDHAPLYLIALGRPR
jgi:SagB-type dehydrogenase family enzyme